MRLYLASSVFKSSGYDFLKMVAAASVYGCDGVQLYLDRRAMDDAGLLENAAAAARQRGLEIVAHVPDAAGVAHLPPLLSLLRWQRRKRAMIHYLPGRRVCSFAPVALGFENAVPGFDRDYYTKWLRAASRRGAFLAFDAPRLFGRGGIAADEAYAFIRKVIARMGKGDFLHVVDLRKPGGDAGIGYPSAKGCCRRCWRI